MFDRVLSRMREKVRARQYVMTLHAEDEMNDDGLSVFDIESAVLTGKIIDRQRDQAIGEWKYLVSGATLTGDGIVVVGKLSLTDRLVIITVYRE